MVTENYNYRQPPHISNPKMDRRVYAMDGWLFYKFPTEFLKSKFRFACFELVDFHSNMQKFEKYDIMASHLTIRFTSITDVKQQQL